MACPPKVNKDSKLVCPSLCNTSFRPSTLWDKSQGHSSRNLEIYRGVRVVSFGIVLVSFFLTELTPIFYFQCYSTFSARDQTYLDLRTNERVKVVLTLFVILNSMLKSYPPPLAPSLSHTTHPHLAFPNLNVRICKKQTKTCGSPRYSVKKRTLTENYPTTKSTNMQIESG